MMWALHRAALANGIVPVVPAAAMAEGFRTEARGDRLEALLAGAEVEALSDEGARRAGELAARADTADLVAVATAEAAARRNCAVVALATERRCAPPPACSATSWCSTPSEAPGRLDAVVRRRCGRRTGRTWPFIQPAEPAQRAGERPLDPEELWARSSSSSAAPARPGRSPGGSARRGWR